MRYSLLIFLLLFQSLPYLTGQETGTMEEQFDEGEYFYKRGDFDEALFYYLKLVENQPENAHFNFKAGECFMNIPGKETKAIPYFLVASRNITDKKSYRSKSFNETRAPLHVLFYLGNAYRINNELDKALEVYEKFVNSPYYWENYNLVVVENEIKSSERAKIIQDNPVKFTEHKLDTLINSGFAERNPAISGNGNSMVFLRSLKFYNALFYSVKSDNIWLPPVNINPQVVSDGEYSPVSLSFDGKILFLVNNDENNKDIFISYLQDGIWSKLEKLDKPVNTIFNETHACLNKEGNILYFTSNRPRGEGGTDIYMCKKNKNGEWGKAKNLGKEINTEFDEDTPFITNDNKTLFFSSKGHYNMGGFDVFYTNMGAKSWGQPINLGYPINTTSDDRFIVPVNAGKIVYLSKISSGNTGDPDIFELDIQSNLYHLYQDFNRKE
ncbi:MAG: tetratricopeptide repeat protein [Bacteroidales bacterium]|nr:tetratricopeptide repeat protein [Bacteroidales bacterium]